MNTDAADRMPDPLRARLGRVLESALNRVLDLDEETGNRLAALEGRRIGVEFRGTPVALAITVRDARLRVGPHWQEPRDLDLRGSAASLAAMLLRRADDESVAVGKTEISGDAELARRIEQLARGFRPDFEEAFTRVFGDVLGVPLANAFGNTLAWGRDSARSLALNASEYLREESRDLVSPAQMNGFLDDVDELRERSDRLEARVGNLLRRIRGEAV